MARHTGGDPARPRLLRADLVRVFVAVLGAMASFFLLLPVVPLYATTGGAGERGAGVTTAALLLSTVGAELITPQLMHRFGHRWVFASGLLLLGLPMLVLVGSSQLAAIVAVNVVRGVGFGIVVVLGSAQVAAMSPPSRRGEGLGLYGVVIGVPGVLVLPFGVFLVDQVGFVPVLVAGGVLALTGLPAVAGLPGRPDRSGSPAERGDGGAGYRSPAGPDRLAGPGGVLAVLRAPALLRPAVVFGVVTMAAGVIVTFLPLAVTTAPALGALGLLVHATTALVARWWAGRYGDRHDPAQLIVPALLAAAGGVLALILVPSPVAVLAGMALFGLGFGTSQNASLALMLNRVAPDRYGAVSALWNLAFDAGMGLGAAGFGVLVARTGYPVAFAGLGAVMVLALYPAIRDRALPHPAG